jgi:hypothetical protein
MVYFLSLFNLLYFNFEAFNLAIICSINSATWQWPLAALHNTEFWHVSPLVMQSTDALYQQP